jgi:hypothetical protein
LAELEFISTGSLKFWHQWRMLKTDVVAQAHTFNVPVSQLSNGTPLDLHGLPEKATVPLRISSHI